MKFRQARKNEEGQPPNKNRQGTRMQFTRFIRKPFYVEAVEITKDNIEEVAAYIGEVREDGDGTKYILTDPRLLPSAQRVFLGFYMTKKGRQIRCFPRDLFREQFIKDDGPNTKSWEEVMGDERNYAEGRRPR
jgi:hypothetical protein